MKRIAGAFMLLAGLNGCANTDKSPFKSAWSQAPKQQQVAQQPPAQAPPQAQARAVPPQQMPPQMAKNAQFQGPYGEPINAANNPMRGMSPGMPMGGYTAGESPRPGTNLIQAGYLPTDDANGIKQATHSGHQQMPQQPALPYYNQKQGIVPVPQMGPPGAVAAVGALPYRMPQQMMNMRTSVNFVNPDGMRVTWYGPNGWNDQPLITPARYNFLQSGVYRMRLSSIANRLEKVYYPTLEVVPGQETTATYLAHSSVPVTFTDEDFEQVDSGNFLVKVVYLPNPNNQDLATVVGPNELVSTRLEPGIDPIVEAQRRGTILLIIRLGNIDLNAPNSPAMDAPNPYMMQRMPPPQAMMGPQGMMPNMMGDPGMAGPAMGPTGAMPGISMPGPAMTLPNADKKSEGKAEIKPESIPDRKPIGETRGPAVLPTLP